MRNWKETNFDEQKLLHKGTGSQVYKLFSRKKNSYKKALSSVHFIQTEGNKHE